MLRPASLPEGSLVGDRYVVEALAGQGGMGEVYRARDKITGERVALKLLQAHARGTVELERFSREARLLAELRHPGIVAYLAHGRTQEGRPFLAMEWLPGEDLAVRLGAGPLRLNDCMTLLTGLTDALAAAHRRGVVHRDIKPSNLFLRDGRFERVTLLDFGIARQVATAKLTRTGQTLGTPGYMAPEQARGEHDIGPSADVYALGCVLFECLTGAAPFVARDAMAVLVKVLFEDVPSVDALRPGAPRSWCALVSRMLAKDPARRPRDAAALRDELAALEPPPDEDAPAPSVRAGPAAAILGGDAMRLFSLILAVPSAVPPVSQAETLPDAELWQRPFDDGLRAQLTVLGGRVECLADGSLAVLVPPSESALDQVAQAARCALAVQKQWPEAVVALTTGRALLERRAAAGEAIERAASLLRLQSSAAKAGSGVWLDELSARLLEPRFAVTLDASRPVLQGERLDADVSRPLLGRPTPCVGREQELAILSAALHGCVDRAQPSGALVIAPPGVGKSRLKHELLRRLGAPSTDLEVLSGCGTPMNAGSPHGLLGEALRRLCQVEVGDPPALQEQKVRSRVGEHTRLADAARVAEFVAALCGVAVQEPSAVLRAARSDPKIMSEQVQLAFLDFLGGVCAARPCLLVLEDLHWSDPGTVRLVDAALLELRDRPLFVLAFTRPEVHDLFPRLWEGRPLQRMQLGGLSRKAAAQLIAAALGGAVSDEAAARLIEQAGGNALFLEELIRAAAEGKTEEHPDTVLAMLQAKLSCMDTGARRVLCAASVFGRSFWRGGVRALLGEELGTEQTEGCLTDLVQSEVIERQRGSRFPEETEYRFRHALVRDAAYGLLPEGDRALGHRLAGAYLERLGERDPMVLAEHARYGGELERAALHYARAAEQSYQADDHEGVIARVERGLACSAEGEVRGRLLALKLEVCFWHEDFPAGLEVGREALALLSRGGAWWSKAASSFVMLASFTNHVDEFRALADGLADSEPEPDAAAAYCTAASLAVAMFTMRGRCEPQMRLLARLSRLAPSLPGREAVAHGLIHYCRGAFEYWLGQDLWAAHDGARRALAAFCECGATYWQSSAKLMVGQALSALGARGEGERLLRGGLEDARRIRNAAIATHGELFLLLFLAERCAPEARGEIAELAGRLTALDDMEYIQGPAHGALAELLLSEGRLAEARRAAERGLEVLQHFASLRPTVYKAWIEILLRGGRADEARRAAEEGLRCLEVIGGGAGHAEVPLRLAAAEARAAAGDVPAAREALAEALRVIDARARGIPDPAVRARYLEIPEHVRARALGRAWLEGDLIGA